MATSASAGSTCATSPGLPFDESEVTGSGDSGKFLVGLDDVWVIADSRYTIAVHARGPGLDAVRGERPARRLLGGPRRDGGRAAGRDRGDDDPAHHLGESPRGRADVELVPVEGWVEADRQLKEPAELERVAAASAVADRALAALLPSIRPGVTEIDLALDLEWRMRTGGADRLAFDVACLAGAEAALPHGSPGDAAGRSGAVLLFDFGAQVEGYRSDMTRTLFVGEPTERDRDVYRVVAAAQDVVFDGARGGGRRRRRAASPAADRPVDGRAGP